MDPVMEPVDSDLARLLIEKSEILAKKLGDVSSVAEITTLIMDSDFNLKLLQWRLLKLIRDQGMEPRQCSLLVWILEDYETLEYLLTSGDILGSRWSESLNILCDIIQNETRAKNSGYYKRLAVATAITFSTPVMSHASYGKKPIDPIERYRYIVKCADEEKFYPVHTKLSTWLLRYVVASWAESTELDWARQNVKSEFNDPKKIGEATHNMIKYKEHNDKGVSIHDGAPYYDNKPCTLAILYEYGAVCGGVSKFGVGMSQAFGIPACPVRQPEHCAFLWWKDGTWVLSNGVSSIAKTFVHRGIQWTWNKRCDYQFLFDRAQKKEDDYRLSEKLRWLCKFINDSAIKFKVLSHACYVSPNNYLVWKEMIKLAGKIDLLCLRKLENEILLISSDSKVEASVQERAENITDGTDSEWYCRQEEGWVEIDLGKIFQITEIGIKWWGISWSKNFDILVDSENGVMQKIATQDNSFESPKDYNEWTRVKVDNVFARKIKFLLSNGCLDPWDMNVWIGVRRIEILGREVDLSYDNTHNSNASNSPEKLKAAIEESIKKMSNSNEDSEIISRFTKVKASVEERKDNVVDGTGSEWYCQEQEGWLEITFKNISTVDRISIQWWGISWSKQYQIFAAGNDGTFRKVKTESDAFESPQDYNEWSQITGWDYSTKKVKFIFKDGCLDPWNMNVWIGVRQINVYGKEKENSTLSYYLKKKIKKQFEDEFPKISQDLQKLVDTAGSVLLSGSSNVTASDCLEPVTNLIDGTDSEWWTQNTTAWVEMDFKEACRVTDVSIKWWVISFSKKYKVLSSADKDGNFQVVATNEDAYENPGKNDYNGWSRLDGWSTVTRKLRIEMSDGCLDPWFHKYYIGIRRIEVKGHPLPMESMTND